jgi:hypothetical protein
MKLSSEENGSISILVMGLFLVLLILSASILDASDAYMAKRELLAIGERALTKSVHYLSLQDYYTGGSSAPTNNSASTNNSAPTKNSGSNSASTDVSSQTTQFIPLDCPTAIAEFEREISISDLRGEAVTISSLSCDGYKISAQIEAGILPIINFPLINSITGPRIKISAAPAAASVFGRAP